VPVETPTNAGTGDDLEVKVQRHEHVLGSDGTAPRFPNLGTRRR